MVKLSPRHWRRFVRAQRSREVARWLRWTQTIREISEHYTGRPIGTVEVIEGAPSMPRAIIHVTPEALMAPTFPEAVAALTRAIEAEALP